MPSSNMLYPKEDRNSNKLMFACRTCQFSEDAVSSCVFRNNLYNTVGETAGVTQDVGSDPTVSSHLYSCTLCGEEIGLSPDTDDIDDASSLVGTNKVEDLVALMAQLEESEEEH